MASEHDDLAALYGDLGEAENNFNGVQSEAEATSAGHQPGDEDDILFAQLYGAQPEQPKEKSRPKEFNPYVAAKQDGEHIIQIETKVGVETGGADGIDRGQTGGGGEDQIQEKERRDEEEEEEGGGEEEEDDDDLMITLDENATAYEPSQVRFQYQRSGAGEAGGATAQQAIGAAPGQHMDDAAATIPGLGVMGTKTAIGGIPRSAIPGLATSFAHSHPAPVPTSGQLGQAPQNQMGADKVGGKPASKVNLLRSEDAVFPSQWQPGLAIKLPGQTRVSPEEYREFLSLGHGDIYDINLDYVVDPPWQFPGIDPSDFFNFGMNETTWKEYTDRVKQFRMEYTLKNQIQTLDQGRAAAPAAPGQGWTNVPAEVAAPLRETDIGEQTLGMPSFDQKDDQYEAFVTSERPPRVSWHRLGSPWDHTIVLTGQELEFAQEGSDGEALQPPVTYPHKQYHQHQRPPPPHLHMQMQMQMPLPMPLRPVMAPAGHPSNLNLGAGPGIRAHQPQAVHQAVPPPRRPQTFQLPPPFIPGPGPRPGMAGGVEEMLPPPFIMGGTTQYPGAPQLQGEAHPEGGLAMGMDIEFQADRDHRGVSPYDRRGGPRGYKPGGFVPRGRGRGSGTGPRGRGFFAGRGMHPHGAQEDYRESRGDDRRLGSGYRNSSDNREESYWSSPPERGGRPQQRDRGRDRERSLDRDSRRPFRGEYDRDSYRDSTRDSNRERYYDRDRRR